MCIRNAARGFSLIELIVMVVVLAVGITGILSVYTNAIRGSADPLVRKQALAVAEAMLDEIRLNSFDPLPGIKTCGGSRASNDDVLDYDCPASAPIVDIDGVAVPGLSAYSITMTVAADGSLGPGGALVPPGNAKLISVTVSGPGGVAIALTGYKAKYP